MLSAKFIPLDSDCVKAAAWLNGRIAIRFPSGRVKFYSASVKTFQELMSAESAGAFYNQRLKFRKDRAAIVPRANTREPRPGSQLAKVAK